MYNDYPTIYESTINENFIYLIVLGVIVLLSLIITFISLAKIFKKANRSGISAIIPIYNTFILLEIVNLPKMYFLLSLIPGVNLIIYFIIMFNLAKFFRKSKLFALGLIFLPFIFYPILAFSDSEYIGINLVAMEGKSTIVNIPQLENTEETVRQVNETVDESSKNINISIGGGVYQKNYTKTLLDVDNEQAIYQNSKNKETAIPQIVQNQSVEQNNSLNQPQSLIIENKNEQTNNNSNNLYSIDMPQLNQSTPVETKTEVIKTPQVTQQKQDDGFVQCPKCGAQVKMSVGTCFLCGQKLN